MKTSYTQIMVLAFTLANATLINSVQAKLLDKPVIDVQPSVAELNIENEINANLDQMLSVLKTDMLKNQITKQLTDQAIALQTDLIINDVNSQLPAFKFKVVIAD